VIAGADANSRSARVAGDDAGEQVKRFRPARISAKSWTMGVRDMVLRRSD